MAKMFIDTSTWMELAQFKFNELFDELVARINRSNITLLVNSIIIDEWDRNKHKVLKGNADSIKAHAKSALKLAEFLRESEASVIRDIVAKYRDSEKEQLAIAELHFDKVDKLLRSAEVVVVSTEVKLEVADRALTKKAPFHNSKNNYADALHFFSAMEFVNKQYNFARDLIFVTANYKEFSDVKDSSKLHHDLEADSQVPILFSDNVARALDMNDNFVGELDEYHEQKFIEWIDDAYDTYMNR